MNANTREGTSNHHRQDVLPLRQWALLYGVANAVGIGTWLLLGEWRYWPAIALVTAIGLLTDFLEHSAPRAENRPVRVLRHVRNLLLFIGAMVIAAMLL